MKLPQTHPASQRTETRKGTEPGPLKLPFSNDSNSLDKGFYTELLHIIGLTETKAGGKNHIGRNKEGARNPGTMLEDAIVQLENMDSIAPLERPEPYGATHQERLFNVAMELSVTWISRILFLKMLEAKLVAYQRSRPETSPAFLNLQKIKSYDDLNSFFFQVLPVKFEDRDPGVKWIFEEVPFLNTSLFEPTKTERNAIFISNLTGHHTIPIHPSTVLKEKNGSRKTGSLPSLTYLLEFLNAYEFRGEADKISKNSPTRVKASPVQIFIKLHNYQHGSLLVPAFIANHMARESVQMAVVQKFNEAKHWNCKSLEEVRDQIEDRTEANRIVNSIRICDPAVGSGRLLISALGALISIKNDLRILQDRNGRQLREYDVKVVNDALEVSDKDGNLFPYDPEDRESQRVQEALFHEKQTLIENCLFGVTSNPDSVRTTRLGLWAALLESAYYKTEDGPHGNASPVCYMDSPDLRPEFLPAPELVPLPQVGNNIKCRNPLPLDWRLEFPEGLHPRGAFVGFDLVLSHPLAAGIEEFENTDGHLPESDKTYRPKDGNHTSIYALANHILKENGILSFIHPDFKRSDRAFRSFLLKHFALMRYLDFTEADFFEPPGAQPVVLIARNSGENGNFRYFKYNNDKFSSEKALYQNDAYIELSQSQLESADWIISKR